MKKLLTVLLLTTMLLSLASCFDRSKTVIVNVYGPGEKEADEYVVATEVETVKDVLDQLIKLGIFDYEYTKLSEGITVLSINGIDADFEKDGTRWDFIRNGEMVKESIDRQSVENGDTIEIRFYKEEKPVEQQPVVGDWVLFDRYNVVLTKEEKEIFEKATADMLSVKYEPIRVIATQIVNGTNYAFLVSQSKVTANPIKEFYIVKIYQDLENNVDFKAINKLDPLKVVAREESDDLLGGWNVEDPDNSAILLDENAQESFNKASEAYSGVNLQPVQLLASQIVNGTNYIALCKGQSVTENPVNNIYIVEWYAGSDGQAEIKDVKILDLAYYTTGE